jgi:hypothetical protein
MHSPKIRRDPYSPKIPADLIPKLYEIKQFKRKPMTQIVEELLRPAVLKLHEEVLREVNASYEKEAHHAPLQNVRK